MQFVTRRFICGWYEYIGICSLGGYSYLLPNLITWYDKCPMRELQETGNIITHMYLR